MAETMTYDPGTDTVTTENSLTPDEQESLEVGEALQEQQEGLLAGKYKNAEDLEKAYGELERKLGEQGNKDSETVDETEVQESDKVSEEEKETSEDSAVTTLLESASKEYYDNDNSLSQETIDKFEEDFGIGISNQNIPLLTKRFFRIDPSRSRNEGNTGLGLSIVKHILNRHGASFKIESEVGKGSKFIISFKSTSIS